MTESAVKAICICSNSPLSLQLDAMIVACDIKDLSPFPSRAERLRRTENDPHFRFLNDIQVLTRDSNNSSSTMKQSKIIVSKKIIVMIIK